MMSWSRYRAQLYQVLTGLLFFLIPSNLFLKWQVSLGYVHGLFVDYLIPKLYLSDLVLIAVLLLWGSELIFAGHLTQAISKVKRGVSLPTVIFFSGWLSLLAGQVFSPQPLVAYWYGLKLGLVVAIGAFWWHHREFFTRSWFFLTLCATLLFQSGLALYQFLVQHSLAGYWLLGEPNLSLSLGLAKITHQGSEVILPYGTTAHPNILGGVLVVLLLMSSSWLAQVRLEKKKRYVVLYLLSLGLGLSAIYATHAWSAWLAGSIGMTGLLSYILASHSLVVKKITSTLASPGLFMAGMIIMGWLSVMAVAHLATILPEEPSLTRRAMLNEVAFKIWQQQPFWGVGFNSFTLAADTFPMPSQNGLFLQPVHHLGLLILAETGLLGLSLVMVSLYLWLRKLPKIWLLASLLPIAFLDHYLLTTQTGWLLLMGFMTFLGTRAKGQGSQA